MALRWPHRSWHEPLVIGLVNNMGDGALRGTERQYRELLSCAAGDGAIRLRLFSLPEVPRGEAGRRHVGERYEPIEALWAGAFDGLIVTGAEPRTPAISDECYWPALTRLIDWAEDHTVSTVWSCLAAHAAAHHLDGIGRRPLDGKLSGVFDCVKSADHPLLSRLPGRWSTPHSRCNELAETALAARGYRILAYSPEAGPDIFVKQRNSLFLFLQGHPEYDPEALLREYRRDVERFLRGERAAYPATPRGYFADAATAALATFRERALRQRDIALLAEFPETASRQDLTGPWRGAGVRLYANWLAYLAEHKPARHGWAASRPAAVPRVEALEAARG